MSHRLTWKATLAGTIAAGAVISVFQILHNNYPVYKGDWPILWYGASTPGSADYPSPYPPTALFLFRPFGLLPVWPAFLAWSLIGLMLFVTAARTLGVRYRAIALALIMPCVLTCLVAGQTSLFVGSALMAGVAVKDRRWSGILFGLAMVVKPQSAVAVPIALLAIGDWRRLFVVATTGATAVALSVVIWGVSAWTIWIHAMPAFQAYLIEHHVDVMDVGINGLRLRLHWPPWVHLFGVVLGMITVATTWRASPDPMARYAALACGAALISPYTLVYDLAGLSVVATAALLNRKRTPADWLVAAPIIAGFWPNPGVIGLACLQAWRYRQGVLTGLETIKLRRRSGTSDSPEPPRQSRAD